MNNGSNYDLKVGFACNNDCIHCVVKPNIEIHKQKQKPLDLSFGGLIEKLNSDEAKKATNITITGGEPTLRRDFMRILRFIHREYPGKTISLQTNGRLLLHFLDEIKSLGINIRYVIALHSTNEIMHNQIVNNKRHLENPYKETMASILKIKELYGDFKSVARIEIVISKMNIITVPETVRVLLEQNIDSIGISYPHLDGYYELYGKAKILDISISYREIAKIIPALYNLAQQYKGAKLSFEEFPHCVWRIEGKLLALVNIHSVTCAENTSVQFPGRPVIRDFASIWKNLHSYTSKCAKCAIQMKCPGIWYESERVFAAEGIMPVTVEELVNLSH